METETYLLNPNIERKMGDFLKYAGEVESAKTGEIIFDAFIDNLANEFREYDSIDPHSEKPFGPLDERVNVFLLRHTGIEYNRFVEDINIAKFEKEDYQNMQSPALKLRLFKLKSRLYLAALAKTEDEGYNIADVLSLVSQKTIPYIKKSAEEPTWKAITDILKY